MKVKIYMVKNLTVIKTLTMYSQMNKSHSQVWADSEAKEKLCWSNQHSTLLQQQQPLQLVICLPHSNNCMESIRIKVSLRLDWHMVINSHGSTVPIQIQYQTRRVFRVLTQGNFSLWWLSRPNLKPDDKDWLDQTCKTEEYHLKLECWGSVCL